LSSPLGIHDGLADGWDLDGPIYAEVADPNVRFGSEAAMSASRQKRTFVHAAPFTLAEKRKGLFPGI